MVMIKSFLFIYQAFSTKSLAVGECQILRRVSTSEFEKQKCNKLGKRRQDKLMYVKLQFLILIWIVVLFCDLITYVNPAA